MDSSREDIPRALNGATIPQCAVYMCNMNTFKLKMALFSALLRLSLGGGGGCWQSHHLSPLTAALNANLKHQDSSTFAPPFIFSLSLKVSWATPSRTAPKQFLITDKRGFRSSFRRKRRKRLRNSFLFPYRTSNTLVHTLPVIRRRAKRVGVDLENKYRLTEQISTSDN